jgi:threonine dehydratase
VVEASGSVGVAALRAGRIKPDQGGTTVVVLTGRNIAPDLLVRVLGG